MRVLYTLSIFRSPSNSRTSQHLVRSFEPITVRFFFLYFLDLDKIQLRDLSKFKTHMASDKLADHQTQPITSDSNQGFNSPSHTTTNPPLPPRGQTPQPFQHRQSLAQFQPKSLYAQKENVRSNSPSHTPLPFQQPPASSSPAHHQTEQIHSQMQPGYRPPQAHYSTSNKPESNAYAHMNSRPSRTSIDQTSPHMMPRDQMPPYRQSRQMPNQFNPAGKYTPNQIPTSSSQSPNVNSVNLPRDSVNGFRQSVDYSSHQSLADKPTAYANRIHTPAELSESFYRSGGLQRNSRPVTGESPYSFKQVKYCRLPLEIFIEIGRKSVLFKERLLSSRIIRIHTEVAR